MLVISGSAGNVSIDSTESDKRLGFYVFNYVHEVKKE